VAVYLSLARLRKKTKVNRDTVQFDGEVREAYAAMSRRLREYELLCMPQIKDIASCWNLYLGRHEKVLRKRLAELNADFDDDLIASLLDALESASTGAWQEPISTHTEEQVFSRYSENSSNRELRCEICGYHFLEGDLSPRRLFIASEYGLSFSRSVHPRREGDSLKPLSVKQKDRYYTELQLDHVRPRSALGRSVPRNISILCRLCNAGKADFVHPLESLSVSVAGSLNLAYGTPRDWHTIVTVVAAFRRAGGRCERSGATGVELTVVPRDGVNWFMPWNLQVIAYDALVLE
jgi:hypothetical protein